MPLPVILGAAKYFGRKYITNKLTPIKELNKYEDEILREYKNPNSPMHKDASKWNADDLFKALNSPSYKHNFTLQKKAKEYISRRKKRF